MKKTCSTFRPKCPDFKMSISVFLVSLIAFSCVSKKTTDAGLVPEPVDYDGKPEIEYVINEQIVGLDQYLECDPNEYYLRMKFKGKLVILHFLKSQSDSLKQVFSNGDYLVTFLTEKYGACAGEGKQYITGKATIESYGKTNTLDFESFTPYCQNPVCRGLGNGIE